MDLLGEKDGGNCTPVNWELLLETLKVLLQTKTPRADVSSVLLKGKGGFAVVTCNPVLVPLC